MLGCRNESVWYQRELTIAEILSDSIVKAMMRADGVDPEMLERDLRSIAQTVQSNGDGLTLRSSQFLSAVVPAQAGTHTPRQGHVAGPAATENLGGYGSPCPREGGDARGRQRLGLGTNGERGAD